MNEIINLYYITFYYITKNILIKQLPFNPLFYIITYTGIPNLNTNDIL